MPTLDELSGLPPEDLYAALAAGLDDLSKHKRVHFGVYTRTVLPLDGYVFWLRSGSYSATGVVHHTAERSQDEDETYAQDSIVFTTKQPLVELNASNTQTLLVGEVEGVKYAFRTHGWFFAQAGIWHYTGMSVRAAKAIQLIDNPAQFDANALIVSNSLPSWLALATYSPEWLIPPNPGIPLFPSFLVPDNLSPPYGAIHIEEAETRAIQGVPWLRAVGTPGTAPTQHTQLASDRVRVTLWGCDNPTALAFLDLVLSYSRDTDAIGLMNTPIVRDGKRTWPEGMILGQHKTIEFEVSYLQAAQYAVADQLVLQAAATVQAFDTTGPGPSLTGSFVIPSQFPQALPSGARITGAMFQTVIGTATVEVGTTPGGNDVLAGVVLDGTPITLPQSSFLQTTFPTEQELFVSAIDGFGNALVEATIFYNP